MNCHKLNEGVQHKIENALEGIKREKSDSIATYFKSVYGPATLINDWYEKRIEEKQKTIPEPIMSEQMESYRQPCRTMVPDRRDLFTKVFEGNGLGQKLLIDHQGLAYYDNYVTTSDLMYNHLTKGICGPFPRRYQKGKYKPETDLTKIYGNLTQWGIKEKVIAETKKSEKVAPCLPVSEMISEYVAYDANEIRQLNDFPKFKRVKAIY